MGHEFCGTVVEAGSAVQDLKPGDRVLADQGLNCLSRNDDPPCEYCVTGDSHQCARYAEHGITGLQGALAELVALAAVNSVKIESDPLKAIEGIKAFQPDLVLLDWMMPGMDGPTLMKTMREQPETAGYPVVFITAKATQKDHAELLSLGAAGIVSKPFSAKDLPEQLRAIWTGLP